jgi:glycosyltransferase involved in cell wall biosynthesis
MFRGGGENYTLHLADELRTMDCNPSFLLAKPLFSSPRYPLTGFQTNYVSCPYLRDLGQKIASCFEKEALGRLFRYLGSILQKIDRGLFTYYAYRWLKKSSKNYDVVHVLAHPELAGRISKEFRIPTVVFFPGPPSDTMKHDWIRKCTAVTTDGYSILQLKAIRPDAIRIPIGIDAQRFNPVKNEVRSRHRIHEEDILFLYVGRFVPLKNLPFLLAAFSELSKVNSKVRLMMIGEGPLLKMVKKQSQKLGVDHKVFFAGHVPHEHIPAYYSCADIFVLPSKYENSPNALLEAMSCGLPAIASAVGGIPDLVEDGKSGFLVEPGRLDAFVESMERLASNKKLRTAMGACARQICIKKYTWHRTASLYHQVYERISRTGHAAGERRSAIA